MCRAGTAIRGSQRSGLRYTFAASVKVEDPNSGKHIISITSNLSTSGCHVRTSTPFQRGTKITITIKHQGVRFQCEGEVVYAIPGAGMGIRFENEATKQDALNRWLMQISTDVVDYQPEATDIAASSKQKIILVICIVALVAVTAAAFAWLGLLP